MKPERPFTAERVAAMHSDVLVRDRGEKVDLLPVLDRMARALALHLGGALAPLCGDGVEVAAAPAEEMDMAMLSVGIGHLAGNSLVAAGPGSGHFLLSVDAAAILRLVDRAFGGPGDLPEEYPAQFSLSAQLVGARIEGAVLSSAAITFGMEDAQLLKPVRSESNISTLAPFPDETRLATCSLEVTRGAEAAWTITLAFPMATLAALAASYGSDNTVRRPSTERPGPTDEPFAQIPLPVRAVLVDMKLPLAVVSSLQPGQILPVAVARNVPLMAGSTTLARGTVGELDDRIALKITQLP